jgi:hypothetical protein
MTTQTAIALTPEYIALTSAMNLSEAHQYCHILQQIVKVSVLDEAETCQFHELLMDSAKLLGIRATTYVPALGYVQVAAPIAMARAMLDIARHEQQFLLGGGA